MKDIIKEMELELELIRIQRLSAFNTLEDEYKLLKAKCIIKISYFIKGVKYLIKNYVR